MAYKDVAPPAGVITDRARSSTANQIADV